MEQQNYNNFDLVLASQIHEGVRPIKRVIFDWDYTLVKSDAFDDQVYKTAYQRLKEIKMVENEIQHSVSAVYSGEEWANIYPIIDVYGKIVPAASNASIEQWGSGNLLLPSYSPDSSEDRSLEDIHRLELLNGRWGAHDLLLRNKPLTLKNRYDEDRDHAYNLTSAFKGFMPGLANLYQETYGLRDIEQIDPGKLEIWNNLTDPSIIPIVVSEEKLKADYELREGAERLLLFLARNNIPFAILSNQDDRVIQSQTQKLLGGTHGVIDELEQRGRSLVAYGYDGSREKKPHPESFEPVLEAWGDEGIDMGADDGTIGVGDKHVVDVVGYSGIGVRPILIERDYYQPKFLREVRDRTIELAGKAASGNLTEVGYVRDLPELGRLICRYNGLGAYPDS